MATQTIARARRSWAGPAGKVALFALCCLADLSVVRRVAPTPPLTEGQFRRGYFEDWQGEVGLAADGAVRPGMLPRFALTDGGALAVPPGMTAILPLAVAEYEISSESGAAPYLVLGEEAPIAPPAAVAGAAGEARLRGARTWSVHDGQLALEPWEAARPWRDDAARLAALHTACGAADAAPFVLEASAARLDARFGRCTASEPRPATTAGAPLLAVVAGPGWTTVARRPAWRSDRDPVWLLVVAVLAAKVAASWFVLGPASTVALSAVLAVAALRVPEAAAEILPLVALGMIAIALVRAAVVGLARLPRRYGAAAATVAALLSIGAVARGFGARPRSPQPLVRTHDGNGHPDACAVIGYSTVKGEGLRGERGGIRTILDRACVRCRDETAALFAAGETLAWAHTAYCASAPSFGADGLVAFLGGANDDFMWGVVPFLRLLVVGQQSGDAWRRNASAAAAASRARLDDQVGALGGLVACARERGARFLFLHDFLATDLNGGRSPDRAAMLAARRAAVERAGMTFVDLLDTFAGDVGVSWFNDYVHLSQVAQERIAALACRGGA